jgi:hypothetical protein
MLWWHSHRQRSLPAHAKLFAVLHIIQTSTAYLNATLELLPVSNHTEELNLEDAQRPEESTSPIDVLD